MKENAKSRIISAAKALFGRHGFKKASLADVADKARMCKSSIYHYFTGKEDLYSTVVNTEMEVLAKQIRDAVSREDSPEAKVRTFVLTRMRVLRKLASAYTSLHEKHLDQMGFVERLRKDTFQSEINIIRGILEEGIAKGVFEIADVKLAAYTIALALKGLEYPWMIKSREPNLERDLDLLLAMLMKAIRK